MASYVSSEKRKRAIAEDFFDDTRKRARADQESNDRGRLSTGAPGERHLNHKGRPLTIHIQDRGFLNSLSTGDSLPSPLHAQQPSSRQYSQETRQYPISPRSRSPELFSDGYNGQEPITTEDSQSRSYDTYRPRRLSQTFTSPDHPQDSRINTPRIVSRLDPRGPDYNPLVMASEADTEDGKSRRRVIQYERKPSDDCYRTEGSRERSGNDNAPQSRRASATPKAAQTESKTSTPRTGTPSTSKDMSLPHVFSTPSQVSLLELLAGFAKSVTSAASLSVRQEFTKQQANTQERERDRQRRHKQHFLTMSEDSELKSDGLTKLVARLEQQIHHNSANQSLVASQLASSLQKQSALAVSCEKARHFKENKPNDDSDVDEQLVSIRAELREIRADYLDLRRKSLRQGDLDRHTQNMVTRDDLRHDVHRQITDALSDTKKKLNEHATDVSRLNQKISDLALVTGQRHQTSLETETKGMKRFKDLDDRFIEVQKKLGNFEDSLRELNSFVRGNDHDNGLSLNARVEQDGHKISTMQNAVHDITEALKSIKEIASDAPRTDPLLSSTVVNIQRDVAAMKGTNDPSLSDDIAVLRRDLETLIEEQKRKDDFVVDEIEGLQNIVKLQAAEISQLKQSQTTSTGPFPPPTPPLAVIPLNEKNDKLQGLQSSLQQLTNQVRALDTTFVVQQQKFDGLTSGHLLTCMLQRFQQMYPNLPVNMAAQLSQVTAKQIYTDGYLTTSLDPRLRKLEETLPLAMEHSVKARNDLSEMARKFNAFKQVMSLGHNDGRDSAENEAKELIKSYEQKVASMSEQIRELQQKFNTFSETFPQIVSAVRSDVVELSSRYGSLERVKEEYREKQRSLISNPSPTAVEGGPILEESSVFSDSDTPLGSRTRDSKSSASKSRKADRKRKRLSDSTPEDLERGDRVKR